MPERNETLERELQESEPTMLDGFEVWDRVTNAPAGQAKKAAWVSVLMSGGFGLNRAAREMLGTIEAVKIMYDPKRRRVGFIPTDPSEENSYDVSYFSGCQLQCRKFMEYYGIAVAETWRCHDIEMVDGVLVANLGGAEEDGAP